MEAGKYRHRPVVNEAMQLTAANGREVAEWCGGEWDPCGPSSRVLVPTMRGQKPAYINDWVIRRGDPPEYYPVRPDVFVSSYEPADASVPPAVAAGIARIAELAGRDDD